MKYVFWEDGRNGLDVPCVKNIIDSIPQSQKVVVKNRKDFEAELCKYTPLC